MWENAGMNSYITALVPEKIKLKKKDDNDEENYDCGL